MANVSVTLRPGVNNSAQSLPADDRDSVAWAKVTGKSTISTTGGLQGGGSLDTDLALSVADAGITNSKLANMAATTLKGNSTAGATAPSDLTVTTVSGMMEPSQAVAEAATSAAFLMTPRRVKNQIDSRQADQSTAEAGVSNTALMTPLRVKNQIDSRQADQSTAEAGVSNTALMTPLRVKNQIDSRQADQSTAETGTNNTALMTPLRTAQALANSYANSPSITTPTLTNPNVTGALAITQTTAFSYGLNLTQTYSGSQSASINANLINVTDSAAITSGSNFVNLFTVQGSMNSATLRGNRQGIYGLLMQTTASSNKANSINANFCGVTGRSESSSGEGGTDLTTNAYGAYFGMNAVTVLKNGAVNVLNVCGHEINVSMETGSSAKYKFGLAITNLGGDAVSGTAGESMISLGNQADNGWNIGLLFSAVHGYYPIKTTGTLIYSSGGTIATGIDVSTTAITGSALKLSSGQKLEMAPNIYILSGTGTPEAAVTANVGSLYLRDDGSTSTTLYVKTSGSGNTGWTAK